MGLHSTPDRPTDADRFPNRVLAWVGGGLLLFGLFLTVTRIVVDYQTPGPFTPDRQGLCDFHNGIYFPAQAAIVGESPYSDAYAAKYPVARQIPFFSPVILWLHSPLAVLPLRVAEVLNTVLQIALLFGIALVACRAAGFGNRLDVVLAVAAAIVFTRAGHVTLFNGYFTFQIVLATFLAFAWAERRPWASGWMLMIVSAKPTYILPLGFLMLARGNWRALLIGAALSITGAIASLGWIAYREGEGNWSAGVSAVVQQIADTQEVHRGMEDESPIHSWTRLDTFAIVAKWADKEPGDLSHLLAMLGLIAVPMWVLWRRRLAQRDDGIAGIDGALAMTAMLTCLYHQSYDALLVVPPILGCLVATPTGWRATSRPARLAIAGLLGWPLVNYLSTQMFLLGWELSDTTTKVLTSLNGVSLAIALVMICVMAINQGKESR